MNAAGGGDQADSNAETWDDPERKDVEPGQTGGDAEDHGEGAPAKHRI